MQEARARCATMKSNNVTERDDIVGTLPSVFLICPFLFSSLVCLRVCSVNCRACRCGHSYHHRLRTPICVGPNIYGRLLMPKLHSSRLVYNVEIGAEIGYVCGVMRPILESIQCPVHFRFISTQSITDVQERVAGSGRNDLWCYCLDQITADPSIGTRKA